MEELPVSPGTAPQPRWQPIAATDRRVIGVLVEKAKTTPDAYPMSISALRSGCNQKNNRFPLMELEQEDIEESLERLRAVGAVTEVQGGGRVARYRHHLYEWLGVDKVELAVMAELLLRGAQTEGELRGRAARMEPIADLSALRPVLTSLKAKGLVIPLTPEGRGHVVTHALYEERELEKLRREFAASDYATASGREADGSPVPITTPLRAEGAHESASGPAPGSSQVSSVASGLEELRAEVGELRGQIEELRKDLNELWSNFR